MKIQPTHALVLDPRQADVLWRLDAAAREVLGEDRSPISAAARSVAAFKLDSSLSDWEIPAYAVSEIEAMLVRLGDRLPSTLAHAAGLVVAELGAVVASAPMKKTTS